MAQENGSKSVQANDSEPVPKIPAFSTEYMDKNVDPGVDFYRYSAGNWLKNNPIPADKSTWGSFGELRERNLYVLHKILERCASPDAVGEKEKQLGRFFLSAMNTKVIEERKLIPIQHEIDAIRKISSQSELLNYIAKMHVSGIPSLFTTYSDGDKKRSTHYALYFWQGGTSLPSKDYYLSENFEETRKQFEEHVAKTFVLEGKSDEEAKSFARVIMDIETFLAKASRYPTELRDDEKNYNKVERSQLDGKYPSLHLTKYLTMLQVPDTDYVVVGQPEFYESLEKLLSERSLDDWKIYLEWNLLRSSSSFLHEAMEMEDFDFYHRKLMGQQEPEARWKRSLSMTDALLGESLGEIYVREYFGKESEEKMSRMVEDIKNVFKDRLNTLPWMTDETKKQALAKFARFRTKIGHPVKYRDYSSIVIKEDDYYGNIMRATAFEVNRQIQRVGKEVDKEEWEMTPPTVNAYFHPTNNEIVFPAGILQPPYFDSNMDDAVNYGGIGGVISHEITHGYDDQGRHFDQDGNLKDWWKPEDEKEFLKRTKAMVDLYSSLEVLPGVKVNGELTLGENIADFGGVSIAFEALQRRLAAVPSLRKKIDGLTPEQRFYISWAQVWRQNVREQEARRRVTIDPHAPDKFRATQPATNHQDFEHAFDISGDSSKDRSRAKIAVW